MLSCQIWNWIRIVHSTATSTWHTANLVSADVGNTSYILLLYCSTQSACLCVCLQPTATWTHVHGVNLPMDRLWVLLQCHHSREACLIHFNHHVQRPQCHRSWRPHMGLFLNLRHHLHYLLFHFYHHHTHRTQVLQDFTVQLQRWNPVQIPQPSQEFHRSLVCHLQNTQKYTHPWLQQVFRWQLKVLQGVQTGLEAQSIEHAAPIVHLMDRIMTVESDLARQHLHEQQLQNQQLQWQMWPSTPQMCNLLMPGCCQQSPSHDVQTADSTTDPADSRAMQFERGSKWTWWV